MDEPRRWWRYFPKARRFSGDSIEARRPVILGVDLSSPYDLSNRDIRVSTGLVGEPQAGEDFVVLFEDEVRAMALMYYAELEMTHG